MMYLLYIHMLKYILIYKIKFPWSYSGYCLLIPKPHLAHKLSKKESKKENKVKSTKTASVALSQNISSKKTVSQMINDSRIQN